MTNSVKIPTVLYERLCRCAEEEGVRLNQLADHAIRVYLEEYPYEQDEAEDDEAVQDDEDAEDDEETDEETLREG